MLSEELQKKLDDFNAKYNVHFDIESMENSARIDDSFEEYKFDKKDPQAARVERYYKTLMELLDKAIIEKTKITGNGQYDIGNFNLTQFVDSFEALLAQRSKELGVQDRPPFETIKRSSLFNRVHAAADQYNQPVYGIWAKTILDKKFTYRDLKAVSDNAVNSIEANRDSADGVISRRDLTNVVYAKEAMEKVRQSRTGWWKLFHLYENFKEWQYLTSLTEKVTEYAEAKFRVKEILDEANPEMLKTAYDKPSNGADGVKPEAKKEVKKSLDEVSVADEMQKVIGQPNMSAKLTDEIMSVIPEGGFNNEMKRNFLSAQIHSLTDAMQSYNRGFDDAIEAGEAAESQMPEIAEGMFQKAYSMVGTLGYETEKEQVLAAQAIADVMLKKLSPVALDTEKLGDFANGYVCKNSEKCSELTGLEENDPALADVKAVYEVSNEQNDRQEMNVPDAAMSDDGPKVSPVQTSAPVVKPPIINN